MRVDDFTEKPTSNPPQDLRTAAMLSGVRAYQRKRRKRVRKSERRMVIPPKSPGQLAAIPEERDPRFRELDEMLAMERDQDRQRTARAVAKAAGA